MFVQHQVQAAVIRGSTVFSFQDFTRNFLEDQSPHQTDESFSLCCRHNLTLVNQKFSLVCGAGYEYSRSKRQELTSRQLSEPEILHGACSDQRLLRVVQHMREGIHTNMEVCYVNTHGLLSHSRLISVTWGLENKNENTQSFTKKTADR